METALLEPAVALINTVLVFVLVCVYCFLVYSALVTRSKH